MLVILVFLLFFLCFSFSLESRLIKGVQILSFTVLGMLLNVKICISPYSSCSLFSSVGGFEVSMVTLSIWVSGLMLLVSLKYSMGRQNPGIFVFWVLVLLLVMIGFFLTDSFLVLYVCFEVSLLPTLVLILKWGYQPERLQASFYFIIYTICASLPLLFSIVKMKNHFFSFSMDFGGALIAGVKGFNFGLAYWALVMAFLVKVPMWGVHLWLPKAHVEAPVSGSMVLAGVLLKLGGYGLVKVSGFIYKISSSACCLVYAINLWGAFIISFMCLSCVDMKTLIAYSSVVHMNLMVLGVLSDSLMGVVGSMLMMISHGVSSPGMFAMANMNYEKVQSRNLLLQKGFCLGQPSLMFGWFVLLSANMAAPPSLNLFSEILIIMSVLKVGFFLGLVVGFVTFLSAGYNLYLYSSQQGSILVFGVPSGSECSVNLLVYLVHCFVVYALVLKVICIC